MNSASAHDPTHSSPHDPTHSSALDPSHGSPHVTPFHRTAIRVAIRGALSISAVLGLGLGIAAIPTPASASANAPKPPDPDDDALLLSTTTDTLPEDAATHFETIAGDAVHRVYYVHNRGLLPLDNITVSDPDASGATIHCGLTGASTIPTLLPLAWTTCSATFTATPGEHHTTATASGTVFLFNATVTGEDDTGYTAVVPALSASLSLGPIPGAGPAPGNSGGLQPNTNLPIGSPIPATVTISNTGSVALTEVTPAPQSPLSISGCAPGDPVVHNLDAGKSADCTGVLIPAPGPNVSSVTITGIWQWDHPITEQGPQQPEQLTIQTVAEAPYVGVPVNNPPPPPSPSPSSPAPPPPTPAPPSPAVVIPQPPQPSQSPSLSPSSPAPTPTPTQVAAMLQQPVSQFQASRQLPLPLKVLVIIIIPAVAAAAGARRIASSRR